MTLTYYTVARSLSLQNPTKFNNRSLPLSVWLQPTLSFKTSLWLVYQCVSKYKQSSGIIAPSTMPAGGRLLTGRRVNTSTSGKRLFAQYGRQGIKTKNEDKSFHPPSIHFAYPPKFNPYIPQMKSIYNPYQIRYGLYPGEQYIINKVNLLCRQSHRK